MYTQPFKKYGAGQAPGKEAWEEAFAKWQKMFTSMPTGSAPTAAPDEFVNFSKNWFEGYAKVWQTWLESVQKMGDACKTAAVEGEKPGAAMSDVSEISDRFMKEWSAFVSEQAQSFFALWKSRLPAEKKEPKKAKKE
jgi:hypothetical protein